MVNGNPANKIQDTNITNVKVGILCTNPVTWDETLVENLFEITSMKKKNMQESRQCVAIKRATKVSPNKSFQRIGMHRKFISWRVV